MERRKITLKKGEVVDIEIVDDDTGMVATLERATIVTLDTRGEAPDVRIQGNGPARVTWRATGVTTGPPPNPGRPFVGVDFATGPDYTGLFYKSGPDKRSPFYDRRPATHEWNTEYQGRPVAPEPVPPDEPADRVHWEDCEWTGTGMGARARAEQRAKDAARAVAHDEDTYAAWRAEEQERLREQRAKETRAAEARAEEVKRERAAADARAAREKADRKRAQQQYESQFTKQTLEEFFRSMGVPFPGGPFGPGSPFADAFREPAPPPPPPPPRPQIKTWRTTLGFSENGTPTADQARSAYRKLAKTAHPDQGGTHETAVALNRAWDEARRALGIRS